MRVGGDWAQADPPLTRPTDTRTHCRPFPKQKQVMPPLEEDRFLLSFSHIFAGGYR